MTRGRTALPTICPVCGATPDDKPFDSGRKTLCAEHYIRTCRACGVTSDEERFYNGVGHTCARCFNRYSTQHYHDRRITLAHVVAAIIVSREPAIALPPFSRSVRCQRCDRPLTAGNVWRCERGNPNGLCDGIDRPHVHIAHVGGCGWEWLEEAPR